MGAPKLVPVSAWLLLVLVAATGYLYLRLDHTTTALTVVTGERDVATARSASISKTLSLQRQLTEDSNKGTDQPRSLLCSQAWSAGHRHRRANRHEALRHPDPDRRHQQTRLCQDA
jgi:hypothetical protein